MSFEKGFKEECGLFGIFDHKEAASLTYLGLYAQQHRGEEACGIVGVTDEKQFVKTKGLGLVCQVFDKEALENLSSSTSAVGHVRYSTTGVNEFRNIQPLFAQTAKLKLALAHNGNLVNSHKLRQKLIQQGAVFHGNNDTETLIHLMARHKTLEESLLELRGAFCFVILTDTSLIAVRDAHGFRPLVLGKKDSSYVIASETCAFDLIGAEKIRDVAPGEIIEINKKGLHSRFFKKQKNKAQCVFEYVYFSRPDSEVFGLNVYQVRKKMGQLLAKEAFVEGADLVMPVPDSGVPAALGYAEESGIRLEMGIIRNHYIGRTFIQPQKTVRHLGVKIKLNPQRRVLKDKKVVLIDDSLVRGSTSTQVIKLVRQAGAQEIHVRIAAPPTKGPCFYGVDTPLKKELIASKRTLEQIRDYIGANSLAYLSEEGLAEASQSSLKEPSYCMACFNEKYPIEIDGSLR